MGKDIKDCTQTEAALREANLILSGIFDASPQPMFVLDPDGIVRMWNKASEKIFGWTAEEAVGRPLPIVPADKREQHLSFLKRIRDGEILTDIEIERQKKDGSPIQVSLSIAPIKEADGRLKGIISVMIDITSKKKAEEERNAMLHMLTHDIKGPLSVIYGYGDIASQATPDEAAVVIADMQRAGRRIYSIIDDILSLSRLESKEPHLLLRSVPLHELLSQAAKENEAGAAEKGVSISLDIPGTLPRIYADPDQLGRAIGNLVSNAVNYNKKGGKVQISAGMYGNRTDRVFIEVSDNGDGISEEDIPRIFEKYYRGKKSGRKRGTGLGLAIVKAAVDAHGGTIGLESKCDKGSRFTVTLPIKPGMGMS